MPAPTRPTSLSLILYAIPKRGAKLRLSGSPGVPVVFVSVFKRSMHRKAEPRTDRVDCACVEVGQPVVAFCRRPLVFVPQASCHRESLIDAPLILNIRAETMQAHRRIHLDC